MKAEELKRIRERLTLTQVEMAEALGVHPMTISKWERGAQPIPEPIARLVQRIAKERRQGSQK